MITNRSTVLFTTNGHPTSTLRWILMPPPSDPQPGPSKPSIDEASQPEEEAGENSSLPATDGGVQTQGVALN